MSLKDQLQRECDAWASMGHCDLIKLFILRNGRAYEPAPRPPGVRLGKIKECFKNASAASWNRGTYTEGYALTPGLIPVLHAWLTLDGHATELTWRDSLGNGKPRGTCEYFGVEFDRASVTESELRQGFYGLLDSPVGVNVKLMFKLDPGLRAEAERIMGRAIAA